MKHPSAVFLLVSLMLPAARAAEPVLRSVRVEGTPRPVQLETQAGQPLDPEKIRRDVRKLWSSGNFDDIRVERKDLDGGSDVVFHLAERRRLFIHEVKFARGSERRPIRIEKGTRIDEAGAQQIAAMLRKQLLDEGHLTPRVQADLVPAGGQNVDLELNVEPGPGYHVQEVRFIGDLVLQPSELKKALRYIGSKRMIPLLWTSHAPYSEDAVQADLSRLRSLYLSKGYFDAEVKLDDTDYKGGKVYPTISVDPGPRYGISRIELVDLQKAEQRSLGLSGAFPAQDLCQCLLDARRQAEREGRLDFDVRLEAEETTESPEESGDGAFERGKWLNLRVKIETGEPYTVRRIEFRGNHKVSDATIRKALKIEESVPLDSELLRQSLVRLSQMGLFEPVTGTNVDIARDRATHRADITINLKPKDRRAWSFSGPVGPFSIGGPLQGTIMTRLPPWGRGILEASTYYATFSVLGFANPLANFVSFLPKRTFLPLFILERPYLPGQGWFSGFVISPQLGWQSMVVSYVLAQAHRGARAALGSDSPGVSDLVVTVERSGRSFPQYLICEQRKSGWSKLKTVGTIATDLVLGRPF